MEEEKCGEVKCCKQEESRYPGIDALTIGGTVLFGCLIIAGTLAYVSSLVVEKMSTVQTVTQAAGAVPPEEIQVTQEQIESLFTDKNIVLGKKNSKLLFVEFSDPSCPWCHVASGKNPEISKEALKSNFDTYVPMIPEIKKLVDSGKAAFVWLYDNGHGGGEIGTRALYCAHEKKQFWQVHDLLMSKAGYDLMNNQVKNDLSKAGDMAEFLKGVVKKETMEACLKSGKYDDRLKSDMALAQQFGVNGTPGIFVNTTRLPGAVSYTEVVPVVDAILKK